MSYDFDTPALDLSYAEHLAAVRDGQASVAKMDYEDESDANVPEGALQFNRTDGTFEQLASGIWVPQGLKSAGLHADAASRSSLINTSEISLSDGSAAATAMFRSGANTVRPSVLRLPKTCKITHLSVAGLALSSGTVTITLYKNGLSTGKTLDLTSAAISATGSIVAESFAAGDTLELYATTSSADFTVGGGGLVVADAWGHFTE
jgi:hypothetical protein